MPQLNCKRERIEAGRFIQSSINGGSDQGVTHFGEEMDASYILKVTAICF